MFEKSRHGPRVVSMAAVASVVAMVVVAAAAAPEPAAAPGEIRFTLDRPARVSLAVYTGDGCQVRELMRSVACSNGTHAVSWDGLDQDGRPCPPAEYEWRLLQSQGFTSRFRGILGVNPSSGLQGPYPVNWVGDHGGAGIVACDDGGVVIAAALTEGLMLALKQSHDGRERLWQMRQFYDGGALTDVCAGPGDRLYLLQPNGLLRVHRASDGAQALSPWNVKEGDEAPSDMDCLGTSLVLCYPQHNLVRWIDPQSGAPVKGARGIPGARYVALVKGGDAEEAVVAGSNRVFRVRRALLGKDLTNAVKRVLTVAQPRPVAVDRASGLLYRVAGSEGHRIEVYKPDTFEKVREYGGEARPLGRYDADLFRGITSMAADGRGCLYFAEPHAPPRRVGKLDLETGKVVQEWYGGQSFYTTLAIDPADPTSVWGVAPEGFITQYELNYDTGGWKIRACYRNGLLEDNLISMHAFAIPFRRGGTLYLASPSGPAIGRVDEAGGRIVPVAFAGRVINSGRSFTEFPGTGRDGYPRPWVAAVEQAGWTHLGAAPKTFIWRDQNGNGAADADEFLFDTNRTFSLNAQAAFDTNLNYFVTAGMGNDKEGVLIKVPSSGWGGARGDVPQWSWDTLRFMGRLPTNAPGFYGIRHLWTDGRSVFGTLQGGVMIREHGQYEGGAWPYMTITLARLLRWDTADGRLLGAAGRHTKDPGEKDRGKWFYPMYVEAGARGTVLVNDQVFQPGVIWTRDGLYAGSLWDRRAQDGLPDSLYAPYGDDIQGARMVQLKDGRVFYFCMGVGLWLIYQVEGFDALRESAGTVRPPAAPVAAARQGRGLRATKYDDASGRHVAETCVEPLPYYDPFGAPAKLPPAPCKAFWEGFLEVPFTAGYRFEFMLGGNEQATLTLDGKELLSGGSSASPGPVPLTAGKHAIRIEYTNPDGPAEFKFLWWGDMLDKSRVPAELLYEQ